MIEHVYNNTDTSIDAVDFEAPEASSRLRLTRLKRPQSMRSRITRKGPARPGSIGQRRNKRYF